MVSKKFLIILSVFLSISVTETKIAQASESLALDQMNFNYQISPQKGGKPSWYPLSVFSDGKETYIEFSKTVTPSNMPKVYVKPKDESKGIPIWHWDKHYLIINQDVKSIKLVRGYNVVTVVNTQNPHQYIAPPPKYIAKYYQGPMVSLLAGMGQNDSANFSSFSSKLAFGYNWALTRHWLLGLGLGGYYIPSTGAKSSEYKSLDKYGIDLYTSASYLFFNGVYLSAMTGAGYSKDRWTDRSNGDKISRSGLQPEVGLGLGYLLTSNVSVDFNANYIFKAGGLFSNFSLLVGLTYHI